MMILRIIFIYLFLVLIQSTTQAQDFSGSKIGVANFVRRMYNAQPFDGVKVLQNQDGQDYMISVVQLKKDANRPVNIESRIASVKSKSYASQYLNGSNVSSEVVIISSETKTKDSVIKKTDMQEILKETSMGFAEGMELLINFESNDGKQNVYVYYREIKK